jgi:aromatic ring-cleaving dioxygenase
VHVKDWIALRRWLMMRRATSSIIVHSAGDYLQDAKHAADNVANLAQEKAEDLGLIKKKTFSQKP